MLDRFLDFLYAPLSGRAARAVLILTALVCHGYVLVTLLSIAAGGEAQPGAEHHDARRRAAPVRPVGSDPDPGVADPRQDPQDRPRSAAARAAQGELRSHRALQHVPYRGAGVTITLVGARRGRALLSVRGGDLATERRGWRAFLRRFEDDGSAYVPVFAASRDGAEAARSRLGSGGWGRRDRSAQMTSVRTLTMARGEVDLPVDPVVDLPVDLLVDLVVGVVLARTPLIPRYSGDCGDSILQRSLRHIEVGT